LGTAARWANAARGELPVAFSYTLNGARPIAPEIDGKKVFEAMHACLDRKLGHGLPSGEAGGELGAIYY
jgi:hypothetical protein